MSKKLSFAVIGCGRFGGNLAITLAELGHDVLAVDSEEEKVNHLAEYVAFAVHADVGLEGALDQIGLSNVDIAVIAISSDFEASIMATSICRDKGIKEIIAKAKSEHHAKILKQIGATKTVLPEKDMGIRLAHSLSRRSIYEYIELSSDYSIVEMEVPDQWIGRTINQIDLRANFGASVIGVVNQNVTNINPEPGYCFQEEDRMLVLGTQDHILEIEGLSS